MTRRPVRGTAAGTTRGALLRIAGVLGLLLLVAVALGVVQAVTGWSSAWGGYGPLVVAGLAYAGVTWRGRRAPAVGPEAARDAELLLDLLEQERVTPLEQRASGCTNDGLLDVRDLAGRARVLLAHGHPRAAADVTEVIAARVEQDGWDPSSPLGRQVAAVVAAGRQPGRNRSY